MKLFNRSSQPTSCPSCHAGVEAEQISCLECGSMLARRSTLAGAAWRVPVAAVGAVALVMATGIGFASGAVVQDGDVSVAEAPPGQSVPPGVEGGYGDGGGGGSDDLAQLDPPDDGGGGGSDLDEGDGDGSDGDGNGSDGDRSDGDSDSDGSDGDRGGGDGEGDGGDSASQGDPAREEPEFGGPEETRDLATFPAGGRGYTVALKVTSSRNAALREARAAVSEAEGIPAGVISRSDFPSLPGQFVTFAGGRFTTPEEAERARDDYATLGFTGEVIAVGAGG